MIRSVFICLLLISAAGCHHQVCCSRAEEPISQIPERQARHVEDGRKLLKKVELPDAPNKIFDAWVVEEQPYQIVIDVDCFFNGDSFRTARMQATAGNDGQMDNRIRFRPALLSKPGRQTVRVSLTNSGKFTQPVHTTQIYLIFERHEGERTRHAIQYFEYDKEWGMPPKRSP